MNLGVVPVNISEKAIKEIKKTIAEKNIPSGYGLRVGVKGGGCGGVSYVLGFDQKQANDNEYEVDGIPVYVEKKDTMYLMGMEVDFYEGNDARGFTFISAEKNKTH